jgi:1A family penicillin-binding protein
MGARNSRGSQRDWILLSARSAVHLQCNRILTIGRSPHAPWHAAKSFLLTHARRWRISFDRAITWTRIAASGVGKQIGRDAHLHYIPAIAGFFISRHAGVRAAWWWAGRQASRLKTVAAIPAVLGLLLLVPLAYLVYCIATLPIDGGLMSSPASSAITVQADNGQVFAIRGVFKGERLSPHELSRHLQDAIVAIEDRHFFEHGGFYLPSLIRAALRNAVAGGTREGGSTITQQLARMAHLSPERTIKRKVQEFILTIRLEHQLVKEEILARYLNLAYFGAGAYGVDAAAKRYFGKPAKDVSLSEAAMLAGLVRAPSTLAPTRNPEGARQRANLVLDAMIQTGAISAAQAATAREHPAALRVPPDNPPGTNYFVDTLAGEAKRLLGNVSSDLTVRTSLNLNLQSIAESVISRRLLTEGRGKNVTQAALIAMAPDGAILAMVGGRDYSESQFNRATQAKRQPGSLFKLFVYLGALENGFTPGSVMIDRPVQIGNWTPENYGRRFRGEVTLRSAFANSINSVAVQLADEVGIRKIINTARRLGVQSELPEVPSLALGSAEVSLIEMTRAFAAIAGNVEIVEPYSIDSIQKGDQPVFERKDSVLTVAGHQTARAGMLDLLATVVKEGTGRSARLSIPVAGKTGTSQENRDAWFVGFTNDLVVGVWVGNDDNSPTRNVVGGDLPARIWNEFVTRSIPVRAKAARARPITLIAATAEPAKAVPTQPALRGMAAVQTTALIELQGRRIRLYGVEGVRGTATREFRRYLAGREVGCTATGVNDEYRCEADHQDLSRVVLFNGGGRATSTATSDLRRLEQLARSARTGIWADDDAD